MQRFVRHRFRLDSPFVVGSSFVLFVLAYLLLNSTHLPFSLPAFQEHTGGRSILNVLPFYTAEAAYTHIAAYTPEAVRIYHRIVAADVLVLIPLYVLFLYSALRHAGSRVLRERRQPALRVLVALPLVAGVLNLVEDALLLTLIHSYPHRLDLLASFAGMVTASKTLLLASGFLAVLVLYGLIVWSRASYRLGLRECHV